jgi:hypothetical protein
MNGTLTGNRTTARVAPTTNDNFAMPPAAEYGSSDHCARAGFTWDHSLLHETPAPQDLFATSPMKAMGLEFDWQRAEEAYTSFEAAISNRVLALKERHINIYRETGKGDRVSPVMPRLLRGAFTLWHDICSRRNWKRGVLLFGAALMFTLIGFDLMGLLVLYAR